MPPDAHRRSRRVILVVEDQASQRQVVCRALRTAYRVHPAASAERALEIIPRLPRLDAAVVDLHLPGMNGLEFGRRLRSLRPKAKFFLVTSEEGEGVAVQAFIAGAHGFLTKPFRMQTLLHMLESHLACNS